MLTTRFPLLIIDDDPNFTELCIEVLVHEGYDRNIIGVCETGKEAIKLIKRHNYQIVLLDIKLKDEHGIDLIPEILNIGNIKIIMATGYVNYDHIVTSIKLGAFEYIHKPINTEELILKTEKCVSALENDLLLAKVSGRVFLSYAREDKRKVANLYKKLKGYSFSPWMDIHDIVPGENWEVSIERAIRNSNFFMACLSPKSLNKRGLFQKELSFALAARERYLASDIYLIPVRLEPTDAPEQLRNIQWVDYFKPDGWAKLILALKKGLSDRAENVLVR